MSNYDLKFLEIKRQDEYRYYLTGFGAWEVCKTLRDDFWELPIVKWIIQWLIFI